MHVGKRTIPVGAIAVVGTSGTILDVHVPRGYILEDHGGLGIDGFDVEGDPVPVLFQFQFLLHEIALGEGDGLVKVAVGHGGVEGDARR